MYAKQAASIKRIPTKLDKFEEADNIISCAKFHVDRWTISYAIMTT